MSVRTSLITTLEELEQFFGETVEAWRLTTAERNALRGTALLHTSSSREPYSDFVSERMALVVQIHRLLLVQMHEGQIEIWLRRPLPGLFGAAPLDELFGSTDRLRRVRAMLTPGVPQ